MSSLLLKVQSIRFFSHELHPTTLEIFDDYMVFVKRGLIKRNEATISYNHVSQVYLRRGYIMASLEIINTGGVENILIRWLPIKSARKAKNIIDQKIYHTHAKISGKNPNVGQEAPDFERRLARLKELALKGAISQRQFEQKKKEMIESV